MIEKQKIVEKIEIKEDGTLRVSEKIVFIEGDTIDECPVIQRDIVPGTDVSTEPDKIKNIALLVHDEATVDTYLEEKRKRTMGFK